ncbi:AAA family ATPase [Actinoplanes sp. NPDC026619]|uniref:nSTAND1 domain-containing NTPase n=1 Tax=Actinoplanes sp. NPDC026619 TaxID=3155798 RepID=UPI0033FFA977
MSTEGDGQPVGDHRRLHDALLELRRRTDEPSLRQINGRCGVSVGHLSEIFAGKTAPGPDVAVRVAQALRATDRELARVRFLADGIGADRAAQRAGDSKRKPRSGWAGCPYRGLAPFEEEHAQIFYGRRALTRRLLERLRGHRADAGLLLVLGPSGAGKSSLLRAGLMGSLAADGLEPGCRAWPRRVITPAADPLRQLAIHLAELGGGDAISAYEALRAHPEQSHLLVEQALAGRLAGDRARLVLAVDQLEELFTLTRDRAEQERFLIALHSMATTPLRPGGESGALVVAGIRGDFLDGAATFPVMRQAVESGMFAVATMTESELREAITGPAAEAGYRVPEELVRTILDDLRERDPAGFECGALPLLSQVMFVMWRAGPADGLTVAGYRRAGGVADIVRTSADDVFDALGPAEQDLARRVFLHLADATGGRLTRRPGARDTLRAVTGGDRTDEVIEAFASRRLLTVTDEGLVTIAHEELLRSWTRLRDWLQPDLTDQVLHRALADDVHTWQEHDRDPSYLYVGRRLNTVAEAIRRWADDPAQRLPVNESVTEFVAAGHRRDRDQQRIHHVARSRRLAALSRSVTDRSAAEQFAAEALAAEATPEAFDAAGVLLADHRRVIPAHFGAAAFAPDGRLATVGADGKVRIWDPHTGRLVGEPIAGVSGSVHFSPDGTRLAAGAGRSAQFQLWDTRTRQPVGHPFRDNAEPLFSPDSTRVAGGDGPGTVRLWDARTGQPVSERLPGSDMAFSPDSTVLATTRDEVVHLWDARTGNPAGRLATAAETMAFDPAGPLLAISTDDGLVRLWNWRTGRMSGPPLTGSFGRGALVFSPAGGLLAIGGDGTVRLWDTVTLQPAGELPTSQSTVQRITFSPDGDLVATESSDGSVRLWHTRDATPAGRLETGGVGEIVFSPDGSRIATTSGVAGVVELWDPRTAQTVGGPLLGHTGPVSGPVFSPDSSLLITAGLLDGAVRLWNATSARPADELPGTVVAFSGDNKQVATFGAEGCQVWNVCAATEARASLDGAQWILTDPHRGLLAATGEDETQLRDVGTGRVVSGPLPDGHMILSPDGALVATAHRDGTVQVRARRTGLAVGEPMSVDRQTPAMAFSPDGTTLATGTCDGTVRLWDPRTGQTAGGPLRTNDGSVMHLLFSPEGDELAAVNHSGKYATVWLWNPRTGQSLGDPLEAPEGMVPAIAFAADGRLLAAIGGFHQPVRVWDLRAGVAVTGPLGGTDVHHGAFSPDGETLALSGGTGMTRLWDLWPFRTPHAHLHDRAGRVSAETWNANLPDEPFPASAENRVVPAHAR